MVGVEGVGERVVWVVEIEAFDCERRTLAGHFIRDQGPRNTSHATIHSHYNNITSLVMNSIWCLDLKPKTRVRMLPSLDVHVTGMTFTGDGELSEGGPVTVKLYRKGPLEEGKIQAKPLAFEDKPVVLGRLLPSRVSH